MTSLVRLYVQYPLGAGQPVPLTREQAHYLFGVMRLGQGDPVALFNGQSGEWRATVTEAGKRGGTLECAERIAPQGGAPDLWLCFAPVKKAQTHFIVEKAVELGVRRIVPVATERTNSERFRQDRHQAHAIEAAEQCGATFVPEVAAMTRLDRLLDDWPEDRRLMFCDEERAGPVTALPGAHAGKEAGREAGKKKTGPWAILIGPAGGFSEPERARLSALPYAHPVSLGPRILRAETAAVAAITLWQAALGDWR